MAFQKGKARQWGLRAAKVITYDTPATASDVTGIGAAVTASKILPIFDIPPNSRVTGGFIYVDTAWVGPTAATLDVGDGADPDRYTASPVSILATGYTALTATLMGFKYAEADTIDLDIVLTVAAATAGKGIVVVDYIVEDRADELFNG